MDLDPIQVLVVRRLDNTIHWIAIYPLDSVIQPSNNHHLDGIQVHI